MPLLPPEIRIKRKATDDPVELLHVQDEGNNLRQARQFVFKRQRTSVASQSHLFTPPDKSLHPTHSSPESMDLDNAMGPDTAGGYGNGQGIIPISVANNENSTKTLSQSHGPKDFAEAPTDNVSVEKPPNIVEGTSVPQRRCFHLSRDSALPATESGISNRTHRPKGTPAIFIEWRRPTQLPSAALNPANIHSATNDVTAEGSASVPKNPQSKASGPLKDGSPGSGNTTANTVEASTLAAEMLAYANQESERKSAEPPRGSILAYPPQSIGNRQVSRFKPKPQTSRSLKTHPEQAAVTEHQQAHSQDEVMTDATEIEADDLDYVMDVYVRMPAQMFELQDQKNFGILVLDSQPDIDEFYDDDSDIVSDTYDEEEEDENAENHPSHDYPDEEDDFRDEYERDRYDYRDRYAFDTDDYDNDMPSSDDD